MRLLAPSLLLLGLLAAPAAAFVVEVDGGGMLAPGESRTITVAVTDICHDVLRASDGGRTRYEVRPKALPEGATMAGGSFEIGAAECLGEDLHRSQLNLTLSVAESLPGLKPLFASLVVERSGNPLQPPAKADAELAFAVQFRPGLEVALPEGVRIPAGSEREVVLNLTNTGNAQALVEAVAAEGVRLASSHRVIVDAGASRELRILVEGEAGTFQDREVRALLSLQVAPAANPGAVTVREVELPLQVYGAARREAPGVGPVLALALLGGAGVAARRRA
jgi:hypothetical protein